AGNFLTPENGGPSGGGAVANWVSPNDPNVPDTVAVLVNCILANTANMIGGIPTDLYGESSAVTGGKARGIAAAPNVNRPRASAGSAVIDASGVSAADPQLGPLADNGGPTPTMALLPNSPALNAGSAAGAPATDQRGAARDTPPDLGA